ncbi:MAG: 50S ribosomal protein L21 [Phycisphaerales bacterium]|jgi:large subunit ribosomal protein L21|nr:50S ribosomal protein L21 [Phycisphaeraceae bacterium]
MYAVISEGGGQRLVRKDEVVLIDLIDEGLAKPGKQVKFDKVLVLGQDKGDAKVGQPYVAGATVTAEVVEGLVKGDKIYIHKYRRRKGYRRKTGHRQRYTSVKITAING